MYPIPESPEIYTRMLTIGRYHQETAEVRLDKNDRPINVGPGIYPVASTVSLDGELSYRGGVVFDGYDAMTGEERTLIQFYLMSELRELADSGVLKLDDTFDPAMLQKGALVLEPVAMEPVETRRQAIRR